MIAAQVIQTSLMPFSGFADLKKTLLALAVDPSIGGLLILGPKGTGKSSVVRALLNSFPTLRWSWIATLVVLQVELKSCAPLDSPEGE